VLLTLICADTHLQAMALPTHGIKTKSTGSETLGGGCAYSTKLKTAVQDNAIGVSAAAAEVVSAGFGLDSRAWARHHLLVVVLGA
jgi:hypothetical protein